MNFLQLHWNEKNWKKNYPVVQIWKIRAVLEFGSRFVGIFWVTVFSELVDVWTGISRLVTWQLYCWSMNRCWLKKRNFRVAKKHVKSKIVEKIYLNKPLTIFNMVFLCLCTRIKDYLYKKWNNTLTRWL